MPTSTSDVRITLPGNYTVTLNVNTTVNSLTLGGGGGTQTLSAPFGGTSTLTLNSLSTIPAGSTVNLISITLSGSGNIENRGTLNLPTDFFSNTN